MVKGGDLFGDGVNIAARLQTLASAGGTCISGVAHDQVRKILPFAFTDLGAQQVKNIEEPVRVFSVSAKGASAVAGASNTTMPLALPDKPSIAVLPFQNMSGDPEQEYFADGMVEDIITALSRFKSLFVIARNSSFTYKGKAVDIKQVGRELGVRYVLEGSIRKAAGRVRITGQLIEAATGAHLWADRFDGSLEDVFGLQDRVTEQVVAAVQPEVDLAEIARANNRSRGSIDAVSEFYRGIALITRPSTAENNDAALRYFQNAIEIDHNYAPPYGGSALCLMWRRNFQWPGDRDEDDARLLRLANRVRDLGTDDAYTLATTGAALFHNGVDYDGGSDLVELAVRLNPNLAVAYHTRGYVRVWSGLSDEAIADFERNMRLNPRDPLTFLSLFGIAFGHYNGGRYGEAAAWADKAIREFPYFAGGLAVAIPCYVEAGRMDDAKRTMSTLLRLVPHANSRMRFGAIRLETLRMKFREAHLKAGLPE
jgi:TolB-like protein